MRDAIDEERDHKIFSRKNPHVEIIPRVGNICNAEALERILVRESAKVIVFGGNMANKSNANPKASDALVTKTFASIQALLAKDNRRKSYPDIILNLYDEHRIAIVQEYLISYLSNISGNHKRECSTPAYKADDRKGVYFNPVYYASKLIAAMRVNPYAYDIYNELLTASGNEFHLVELDVEKGTRFKDIECPKGIPVGFRCDDNEFVMSPDPDDDISRDKSSNNEKSRGKVELVVLAEDSKSAEKSRINKNNTRSEAAGCRDAFYPRNPHESKSLVIIGVNSKLPFILAEINKNDGTNVIVVDNQSESEFEQWYKLNCPDCLTLPFRECHFRSEEEVENTIPFDNTDQIVLLADGHLLEGHAPVDQIDADTFSKLLLIDHLLHNKNHLRSKQTDLIVEILTPETEEIVRSFKNCSYVVGPLVIGRFITTFTLYPELEKVFKTMLPSGEVDIICRPLHESLDSHGLEQNKKPDFRRLLDTRPHNAIPVGWISDNSESQDKGMPRKRIYLNPGKGEPIPENSEIIYLHREVEKKQIN